MNASTTVVEPRSYSRQMGATSCEIDNGMAGNLDPRYFFKASSCSGFKYENRRQTAMDTSCLGDSLRRSSMLFARRSISGELSATCTLPPRVHALLNAQAVISLDQWRGLLPLEGIMVAPVHALDEQHILKTRGSHEDHPGALALKKCVETESSSEHDRRGLFDLESGLTNDPNQGFDGIFGRGGKLADDEIACSIVHPDQIGESPAGINAASDCGMNCKAF